METSLIRGRTGFFFMMFLWLGLDRVTKGFVISKMELNQSIPVMPDFLHITYIRNQGASFGMLKDQRWLFIALTLIVLAAILWLIWQAKDLKQPMRLLLGLISGGALGNLVDRLRWGAVIDFIDFRGIWPYIFNVADIGVVVGGLLFVMIYLWQDHKKEAINDSRQP